MPRIPHLARVAATASLVAVGLVACGSTEPSTSTAPEPTSPEPTTSVTAAEPTTAAPDDGETRTVELPASGELNGRRVTVEAFGPATLTFGELDPGNEAIYIEVTVENVSAEPWDSSSFQFFLVDETGEEWAPELLGSDAGDPLPQVNPLEQGASSTGFIAYQVPVGSELTLSYAVDLGAGQTIEIPVR